MSAIRLYWAAFVFSAAAICLAKPLFSAESGASLISNGDFASGSLEGWETRYAYRASNSEQKPFFRVEAANDAADPKRGFHAAIADEGQGAGGVYLGQRVRLPETPGALEFSLDAKTFCKTADRSGILDLALIDPAVWDAMERQPAKAGPPARAIVQLAVHKQGEDLEKWTRLEARDNALQAAAAEWAGKEVVAAIVWNTWHVTTEEGAAFDNIWLGGPRPFVQWSDGKKYSFRGEPVWLDGAAHSWSDGAVRLLYRRQGESEWSEAEAALSPAGLYRAEIPAASFDGPVEARFRLIPAGGEPMETGSRVIQPTQRPEHPNIYYNAAELRRMREKAGEYAWAKREFDSIVQAAEAALELQGHPPLDKAGWSHDWVCKDDGASLQFREDHPHDHLCPVCGKEWQGRQLDLCWTGKIHARFTNAAETLGLAYRLTGDMRYAEKAAEILNWYAANYSHFSEADSRPGKGGRLFTQSLSESNWIIDIINAADLAWPAFSEEERRRLENDLIRECAEYCYTYTHGIHNIQCWKNAALVQAGYFLNDPDMIERARKPPLGFEAQIDKGILEDGLWYERSLGYHNYATRAIVNFILPAMHNGFDAHLCGRVPLLFTAPLKLAQPNLVPPSLNDMKYTNSRIGAEYLVYAAAWHGDEEAKRALAYLYSTGAERGRVAFHLGEEWPADAEFKPPKSADLPGAGLAILRQGQGGAAVCAMLEYGEHGGGHGHPDKLQLILYGLGQTLCPDIGTTGYGVDLHERYYKTTFSHNTVAIGGRSQKATTGELLYFDNSHEEQGWVSAGARSAEAYDGWTLSRRLLLAEGLLVDVFSVEGGKAEPIDWLLRSPGKLRLGLEPAPIEEKPLHSAYEYFQGLRGASTKADWTAEWALEGGNDRTAGGLLHLTMRGAPATQAAQAVAPGPAGKRWDTLRVRRQAKQTEFAAVYQMLAPGQTPLPVRFHAGGVAVGEKEIRFGESAAAPLAMR
ncbi:MAG: Alginate lyase [candidate division BRC1 bacterium ADurb.BinA364]|nr:MAG: Alginate lyase [candidate division BRC1 bacterium ADurb.BinA364]